MKLFKEAVRGPEQTGYSAEVLRYKFMILEELFWTGITPERFGEAGRSLSGSTPERLIGAVQELFGGEQIQEVQALLEWPGSYGGAELDTTPFPPNVSDETRAELLSHSQQEGVKACTCTALLYMDARARAFRRFRSLRHQA